jgi:C4-dicarboxylate-specific signal transduction histidine kinase
LTVSDDLLWGFSHALSNRLAAISSITKIIEYSDTGLDPLLSALSDEISTLDRTLALLRLIPRNPDGTPEPVNLSELLPELLEVHRLRGEMREFRVTLREDGEALPVWAEPARLGHALLLLLDAVTRSARPTGDQELDVALTGDEVYAIVRLELRGADGGAGNEGKPLSPVETGVVRELLEESGGELCADGDSVDGGFRFEVRIPTLPEVRRREAGATPSS